MELTCCFKVTRTKVKINRLNPRIALLFLRTRVALGVKSPHEFKQKNNKFVRFQLHPVVFEHGEFKESDCENDRQPEIAIWPPKPEVLISLEL